MTPAEAIKKIRWELRLSQKKLATAVDCTQSAISGYELGYRNPQYEILKRLDDFAKKHNIDVNFL